MFLLHQKLKQIQGQVDPLDYIAKELAQRLGHNISITSRGGEDKPPKVYIPPHLKDDEVVIKKKKLKSPAQKTKKKVEQDYARNAIADYKAGKKKEGNYEKKKALELAAGESGVMMKKSPGMMKTPMMKYDNSPALIKKAPTMMKTNQMGGGVAASDPAAPAKQLKKLGSIISKHMKSN